MTIKSIVILLSCWLLLFGLTSSVTACCEGDPPGDPDCYVCKDEAWVLKDGAECGQDSDCGDPVCRDCVDCQCECDITVNSVSSDKEVVCLNENVTFTASVTGNCTCVDWSGGGDPVSDSGTCTFTTKWDNIGTKPVTATPACGSSKSKSVEVISDLTVMPREAYVCVSCTKDFTAWICSGGSTTEVTGSATFTTSNGSFSGNTLTASSTPSTSEGSDWVRATYNGETTDADHDCDLTVFKVNITTPTSTAMNITTAPAMPGATFHADIEPEDILSKTTFKWYLNMTFTHDTLGELTHRVPTSGTDDVEGNGNWTPNLGGLLAGGSVHVYVQASVADSTECPDDQSGYQIKGTNPTQAQIFSIANDIEEKAVCWKESSHRQFNAVRYTGIGMPLASYAHDGGYGLMQITPSSEAEVWNWNTNLNAGITHLSNAYSQSVQHVNNINTPGIAPNPDPTPDPELTMTAAQHWKNAFSLYRKGTYYYGYELVSGTEYQWVRNSGTGSDYADDVVDIINDPPW